jgi:hypothetical protein
MMLCSRHLKAQTPLPPIEDNGAGYALNFDGTDDQVTVPHNAMLDLTTAITIEAWIKPEKNGTQRIVSKSTLGSVDGYELSISSDGIAFVRFNQYTTGDANRVNATTVFQPGTWYHVAATYNGTMIRLYVNGVEEGSKLSTITTIGTNTSPLSFGAQPTASDSYHFGGAMDEVRLWTIARTETRIKANMTSKLTSSETVGLVGYWRFDETEGTNTLDEAGNGNDGSMVDMAASARIWSGAPLGNASANDYDATGGYSTMLIHRDGDGVTANSTSGTFTGLQIYRVDDVAERAGATVPAGYTIDPLRYFGVKAIGTGTLTYIFVFNYIGHPGISNPTTLKLVRRDNLADDSWEDAEAILDETANTLTITDGTGTEYALASTANNSLPVTLSLFTAKFVDKQVVLNWETQSESNNSGFYVERSVDGVNFETLHFVPGHGGGNSTVKLAYSYTDITYSAGNNYYRLKQMDNDGQFVYSRLAVINISLSAVTLHSFYPNPVSNELNLLITSPVKSALIITVTDISGRVVQQRSANIVSGNNKIHVNISNMATGTYFMRMIISETGEVMSHKFLKK